MKIYYYHTRPIASALKEWKEHTHPGHILYGLTHFPKNGIDPVLHPYKHFTSRWKLMWYNLHAILRCKENYDVVYGTSYRGLELLIFLRALGLFRKPIAVWHHQAVPQSKGWLKNLLSRLFYKGIDCMFFQQGINRRFPENWKGKRKRHVPYPLGGRSGLLRPHAE